MAGSDDEKKKEDEKSLISTLICCWGDLILGKACCLYNLFCCPFVLLYWSFLVYCGGCINAYLNRGFYKFCCCLCRCCGCCWLYTDKDFPPNEQSLGGIGGDSANKDSGKSSASVEWLRANDFNVEGKKMQLYGPTVDARDICQGALGDCWLLAAMACVAEHDGAIQFAFKTKERNPTGKYVVRLYDGINEKWEYIKIDDYVPCDKAAWEKDGKYKPLFTQPNGNELWAMLLEKAFAKFAGSYSAIEGGQTIVAIKALTGDDARWFFRQDDKQSWKRFDLKNIPDKENPKNRLNSTLKLNGESVDSDIMFDILLKYQKLGSILCASGASGEKGLHKGHAYSILDVRKIKDGIIMGSTHRMIKIRNPWGGSEWNGDWSDNSKLWDEHSRVKSQLDHKPTDDGTFWMCCADYLEHWERIGIVHRTIDANALRLKVKDDTACAPTLACCKGCCSFWCCCKGFSHVYCATQSNDETIKVGGGCCSKKKGARVGPNP